LAWSSKSLSRETRFLMRACQTGVLMAGGKYLIGVGTRCSS
jgi:hypothetical protein